MPLYIYGCTACNITVEELRPAELADFPPVECPLCHGLCQREMATVHVLRSSSSAHSLLHASAGMPLEATALTYPHLPDCPCCGPRAPRRR
jgi:putative FmdB family regulatory protein